MTTLNAKNYCWAEPFKNVRVSLFCPWSFIKVHVYIPLLPNDFPELRYRIEAAVVYITLELLSQVSEEIDFTLGVCCITKRALIEHL